MARKSKNAVKLEQAGYPAGEYQALYRFLRRLLMVTHPNQVESMLAYANHVPNIQSIADAAGILSVKTGIVSTRKVPRMAGNSLPSHKDREPSFIAALNDAKNDIFTRFNQEDMIKELNCEYRVEGKCVYRGHTRVAICLTKSHAIDIASALTESENKNKRKNKSK